MNRLFAPAVFVLVVAASDPLLAQSNPAVGTWKLNLGKSRYGTSRPAPKNLTRTVEPQGNGVKVSYEGFAADGSRIAYSFTTNYDNMDSPISGTGSANGADTIAVKRLASHMTLSTSKKAGKVVLTSQTVVSEDGKVTIITSNGTNENGQPTITVSVYDKQ